ncbi:hypothetical protein VTN77DRAFT_6055 [Rasamsonia byssochlamydoides]|uniref:uncharacterized protein n=1 Tax=Rasamsonia byssochlamydoides TaxID=89139 RepID=UPI0037428ADF
MLPPSDSFGHQSRKLAEVLANARQNRSTSSVPPPPPYSAIKTPSSSNTEGEKNNLPNFDYDHDYDYDDDEDVFLKDDASPRASPTTIKIDASISVVGDRNTIAILPVSRLVRSGSSSNGDGSSSNDCKRDDNNESAMQTQCPNLSQQQSSGSARQATTYLQRFQQQRHTQYAELANTIIAGLNSAGLLTDQSRRRVEIEINSAIRIHGTGNVVCAGVLPRSLSRNTNTNANTNANLEREVPSSPPAAAAVPPASFPETKKERNPTSSGDPPASPMEPGVRRKRSNSEPLTPLQAKIQKTV